MVARGFCASVAVTLFAFAIVPAFAAGSPPAQLQVAPIHQPLLAPCPAGSGITVSPSGMASFSAQSIDFGSTRTTASMSEQRTGTVKIVRQPQATSTDFMEAQAKHRRIPSVTIAMHKSVGEMPADTIIALTSVVVVGIDERHGGAGAEETITLQYQTIKTSSCGKQ